MTRLALVTPASEVCRSLCPKLPDISATIGSSLVRSVAMTRPRQLILALSICTALSLPGHAQTNNPPPPPRITPVTKIVLPSGRRATQIEIELQGAPNPMEPKAEPRRIRIDDRSEVRFVLRNISPLDVCTRSTGTPTANTETPPAESLVTTIATGGAFAFGGSGLHAANKVSSLILDENLPANKYLSQQLTPAPDRKVQKDPEYVNVVNRYRDFMNLSKCLIEGTGDQRFGCKPEEIPILSTPSQSTLATTLDNAGRAITNFGGQDFRGTRYQDFEVVENDAFNTIRSAYDPTLLVPLGTATGNLQAIVDEIMTWATDLHKRYDYKTPTASDSGSPPQPPPIVAGFLSVAPTDISISPDTPQTIQLSSGGTTRAFTARPVSDTGWLRIGEAGSAIPPATQELSSTAPSQGFFDLIVASGPIDPNDTKTHYGRIEIRTGRGDLTFVNVSLKRSPGKPTAEDLADLAVIDQEVDQAKATMSLISDNTKAIEASQATLRTAYVSLVKVEDDYKRRLCTEDDRNRGVCTTPLIYVNGGVLVQHFDVGTDRKDTSAGYISCVSDINGTTPTTTNINYSLLYQDVPGWSASAGVLVSFLPKTIIGLTDSNTSTTPTMPNDTQSFQVTDNTPVQVVPMAYVNRRIGRYWSSQYGSTKEDELVWTTGLSGGFGLNPNTGTVQPEGFLGLFVGLNHFMFHPGVDFGRSQSLGGGYLLNVPFPTGVLPTTTPIKWNYHIKLSIGFSVRLAPY